LSDLGAVAGGMMANEITRILKIKVPLVVLLAEKRMVLSQILDLSPGTVIEFEKNSDEPLGLSAGNRIIAEGEAVKVGENFGLRLTRVGALKQIIQDLGG